MKKVLHYLSVLILLCSTSLFAQRTDEELLRWSSTRRLTWDDYRGRPDPSSDAAASTTTYLGIDYKFSSGGFTFKIDSRFSQSRSWGLHKTEYILSHEQGHFDIAEVFARKLHMKMSEYRFDRKSYQKDLKKIYDEVIEEKEETQNAYDKETRHSINRQKQSEWLKRIEEMLHEYDDYANY